MFPSLGHNLLIPCHRQTRACSYSTLILVHANKLLTKKITKNNNPSLSFLLANLFVTTCTFFFFRSFYLSKHQPHKMVKYGQTARRLLSTDCLSVFDHFVGLAFKGLNVIVFVYNRLKQSLTLFGKN